MTDNLPIIHKTHAVNTTATPASSLLGCELAAIESKQTGIAVADLDSCYRQARDSYNRITDYGEENSFKDKELANILKKLIITVD